MKYRFILFSLILIACGTEPRETHLPGIDKNGFLVTDDKKLQSISTTVFKGDYVKALHMALEGLEEAQLEGNQEKIFVFDFQVAFIYKKLGRIAQATEKYENVWRDYALVYNSPFKIFILKELALLNMAVLQHSKALKHLYTAIEIGNESGYQVFYEELLYYIGAIHATNGSADVGKEILLKAKSIAKTKDNLLVVNYCNTALIKLYEKTGNSIAERELLHELGQMSGQSRDPQILIKNYIIIGDYFLSEGILDSAKRNYHKALEYSAAANDLKSSANIHTRIAHIHTILQNWKEALKENELALQLRLGMNSTLTSSSYGNIGMNYLNLNDPYQAERNLLLSLKTAKQQNSSRYILESYSKLIHLYAITNDETKTIQYLGFFKKHADSLQQSKNQINVELQKELFETEEALKNAQDKVIIFRKSILGTLTLLLILGSVCLASRYRKRKKVLLPTGRYKNALENCTNPVESLDSLTFPVCLADQDEVIVKANLAFSEIIGIQPSALHGKKLSEITSDKEYSLYIQQSKLRKKGIASEYKTLLCSSSGKVNQVYVLTLPFRINWFFSNDDS